MPRTSNAANATKTAINAAKYADDGAKAANDAAKAANDAAKAAAKRRSKAQPKAQPKAQGSKRGRPCLLTREIQDGICRALEVAVPMKYAAQAQGISEEAVLNWMRRGKAGEAPFTDFLAAVTRARGAAVVHLTARALRGEKGSSQATWLLERRYEEYRQNSRIEHAGDGTAPIKIEHSLDGLTTEELRRLASS